VFAQLVDDPSAWPDRFKTEEEQDAETGRDDAVYDANAQIPAIPGRLGDRLGRGSVPDLQGEDVELRSERLP
jgi:hypothetical protein